MEAVQELILSSINAARSAAGAPAVALEHTYSDVCTQECERLLTTSSEDAVFELPVDALSTNVELYYKSGLYDAISWVAGAARRDGLLPPGMDANAAFHTHTQAQTHTDADTHTQPGGQADIEAKLIAAATALSGKLLAAPAVQAAIIKPEITHVGIGMSINTDGHLRLVCACVCTHAHTREAVGGALVGSGSVLVKTSELAQHAAETGPGVVMVSVSPDGRVGGGEGGARPVIVGGAVCIEKLPHTYTDEALRPVVRPVDGVDPEDAKHDLSNIKAAVREVSWPAGAHPENHALAMVFPWQLQLQARGEGEVHADADFVTLPVPIAAAHAEALAQGTAAGVSTATGATDYRYVLQVVYKELTAEAEAEVPYDAPRAGYDRELLPGTGSSGALVAVRVPIVLHDDAAAMAARSSAPHVGASSHVAGEDGAAMRMGTFSEITIIGSEQNPGPGFRRQPHFAGLQVSQSAAETGEPPAPTFDALPVSLCMADAPSLPHITSALLVDGADDASAVENCPPGYDIVPINIAELVSAALGGTPHADEDGLAERKESKLDDEDGDEWGAGHSRARLGAWPRVVYLAVCRQSDSDAAAEAAGRPAASAEAGLAANLPPLVDAGLFVAYGKEVVSSDTDPRSRSMLAYPVFPNIPGYSVSMVDVSVVPASAARSSLLDGDSASPPLVRIPVRIAVYSTADVDAAQSFLGSGGVVVIREGAPGTDAHAEPAFAIPEAGVVDGGDAEEGALGGDDRSPPPALSISSTPAPRGLSRAAGDGSQSEAYQRQREQLMELIANSIAEQEHLLGANGTLQRQLAIYFSIRSSEDDRDKAATAARAPAATAAAAFAAADKDKRYREQVETIADERERMAQVAARAEAESGSLHARAEEKQLRCDQIERAFTDFKRETARNAVFNNTGKPLTAPEYAKLEEAEHAKDIDVARVQLRHIHLAAQVAKLEEQLKKREQVAEGLAMIDFEQLKIENSTLNEKIEDRNEELAKLRKKATIAVQVLTHVREKLHFVESENARLSSELAGIEADVAEQRTTLALAKKARDQLRADNEKSRTAQGFAHMDTLAIDFERRKRDVIALRQRIQDAQARYTDLAAKLAAVAPSRTGGVGTAMSSGHTPDVLGETRLTPAAGHSRSAPPSAGAAAATGRGTTGTGTRV